MGQHRRRFEQRERSKSSSRCECPHEMNAAAQGALELRRQGKARAALEFVEKLRAVDEGVCYAVHVTMLQLGVESQIGMLVCWTCRHGARHASEMNVAEPKAQ